MAEALLFGGSGQVGAPVLRRLLAAGWQVHAVSRAPREATAGLRWLRGDLAACDGLPDRVDAILSCGPLDHFARWYAKTRVAAPRVVAFGSTSVSVKAASADAAERDLAARLQAGEAVVFATAAAQGARATLLRPTLVYGAGRDRTLARIAGFARRRGWMALPARATGLRQPVHVDDLAAAAIAALDAAGAAGKAYALPGGETLAYRDMVLRLLAEMQPTPRLFELPAPLFQLAVLGARAMGKAGGIGPSVLARLREDLVFDASDARRDLGYAPRPFEPGAVLAIAG